MNPAILLIELNPVLHECVVCGILCRPRQGLPMWEGLVLPNDWPGEWGGFTACASCFALNDNPPEPRAPIRPSAREPGT